MLSFSLAASSHCTARGGAKQDEAWVRRDVHPKGAFAAAVTGLTNKPESWDWPNLGHSVCEVCSQKDGDLPVAGDGCQLHQGWEKQHEIFSFHIWEQICITYG